MPDLVSIGIGGGSVLRAGEDGQIVVGPDSVGYRLAEEALVFGGSVATLSDAAVLGGRASIGDRLPAADSRLLTAGLAAADRAISEGIDRVKSSRGDLPLVVVGGGSVLLPKRIPGVSDVLRPDHFDVANAIGAAIGTVSGQVDRIFRLDRVTREAVVEQAAEQAREQAIRAGADPRRVELIDLEEIPLTYLTDPAIRIRAKAAGPLGSL